MFTLDRISPKKADKKPIPKHESLVKKTVQDTHIIRNTNEIKNID
jgi:hypothetical protein